MANPVTVEICAQLNQHLGDLYTLPVHALSLPVADYRDQLGEQESQALASMAEKRRHEYSSGRFCAHQVLHSAGVPRGRDGHYDIAIGQEREPCWPAATKGSITHTNQIAAAAVCVDPACRSLGLDIESVQPLDDGVLKIIAAADELTEIHDALASQQSLDSAGRSNSAAVADTSACLAFSAKESVFKCLFPLYRQWLDFSQVQVRLSCVTLTTAQVLHGQFAVELTNRGAAAIDIRQLRGRFIQLQGFIITTAEL